MENFKGILIAVLVGVIAIVFYFKPIFFESKKLQQHDLIQGAGAYKEIVDYRLKTGEEALWSNSMFGGMPSYLTNAYFSGNWVHWLNMKVFRFLPLNADAIFVNFVCMLVLLLVFKLDIWASFLGGLLYGFATFTILSTGAGHIFKVLAIGYAPLVIAGIKLLADKKWLIGLGVFGLGTALEFTARHYQITFYLIIVSLIFTVFQVFELYKKDGVKVTLKFGLFLLIGGVVALGPNIGDVWTTVEYSPYSTRGIKELKVLNDAEEVVKSGLDKGYAFKWSQGKWESFTLFIPYLYGGANAQPQGKDSEIYKGIVSKYRNKKAALQNAKYSPLYWGPQALDGTGGPYYVGVIILFFAFYACFVLPPYQKNWLLLSIGVVFMIAWGKNFETFNYFLFDYVPGFNKFRAVAMALTIAVMCIVILGTLGFSHMLQHSIDKRWYYALYTTLGAISFIWLGTLTMSFTSPVDAALQSRGLDLDWVIADRQSLLTSSALTSVVYVLIGAGVMWLYNKGTLSKSMSVSLITFVAVLDLCMVNAKYLWHDSDKYVKQQRVRKHFSPNFNPSVADSDILKDTSLSYRVFNLQNPFNNAKPSYYHKSIGGYSGVKMQRYQDLISRKLSPVYQQMVNSLQNQGNGLQRVLKEASVLNMLNNKYVIYNPEAKAIRSPYGYGNAWLAKTVTYVSNADEEMYALDTLIKSRAIVDGSKFEVAKVRYSGEGSVDLVGYQPNQLTYKFKSDERQLVLFSEVFYDKGWNAYVDGEITKHVRANYILRALDVPKGAHELVFKFEPNAYFVGNKISLCGSIVLLLICLAGGYIEFRKRELV